MYVIKRDGRQEEVHFDKITARIRTLTDGLDKRFIDPVRRSMQKLLASKRPTGIMVPSTNFAQPPLSATRFS